MDDCQLGALLTGEVLDRHDRGAKARKGDPMNGKQRKQTAGTPGRRAHLAILAITTILALPTAAAAQQDIRNHVRGDLFLYGQAALSVGGMHTYDGVGGGLAAGGILFVNQNRTAALRLEGNLNLYDGEFDHPPHGPAMPDDMLVRTDNTIFSAGIGPQVYLLAGTVKPYVFGTMGFSYLTGEMNISGNLGQESFDERIGFDDYGLALGAGGGLSVQVRGGGHPVALDISASYQHNGIADHLERHHASNDHWHEGTSPLAAPSDEGHMIFPHMVSDFDLFTWRLGASVGLF